MSGRREVGSKALEAVFSPSPGGGAKDERDAGVLFSVWQLED